MVHWGVGPEHRGYCHGPMVCLQPPMANCGHDSDFVGSLFRHHRCSPPPTSQADCLQLLVPTMISRITTLQCHTRCSPIISSTRVRGPPRLCVCWSPSSSACFGVTSPSPFVGVVVVLGAVVGVTSMPDLASPLLALSLLRMRRACRRSFFTWCGKRPTYMRVSSACLGRYLSTKAW